MVFIRKELKDEWCIDKLIEKQDVLRIPKYFIAFKINRRTGEIRKEVIK